MESQMNSLREALETAKEELEFAEMLFSHAVEQELIDEAIYRLEAAECRYAYLLRLAKQECGELSQKE